MMVLPPSSLLGVVFVLLPELPLVPELAVLLVLLLVAGLPALPSGTAGVVSADSTGMVHKTSKIKNAVFLIIVIALAMLNS
jgi:hypothetical protein